MYAPERLTITNPATGDRVGSIGLATAREVRVQAQRARAAQERWAGASWAQRARVIRRFADIMLDRAPAVLDTIQLESGKARRDALSEVMTVATTAHYYLDRGESHIAPQRRRGALPIITTASEWRTPVGLVGLITPWNYPFLICTGDAIPALLAGNAVIIKPSETTPLSAELAVALFAEAGLPEDLISVVHGPGDPVATTLIDEVDHIGFTGSTATGRSVAEAAARRLIPCSLELGGKNPMIVTDSANVSDTVWGLLNGSFPNSGQTCISIERVYAHERIHDQLVAQLSARARSYDVGWSLGFDRDMGSLISADHAQRVDGFVRDAVDAGAEVHAGGHLLDSTGPAFYAPTVLTGVPEQSSMCREEVFGPVVAIEQVASTAEAIARANDSDYGLNASVWAGSRREATSIARLVKAGSVGINSTLLVFASPDVPMGGVRQSGLGRRHGAPGIQKYTDVHSIVSSIGWQGGYESLVRVTTTERRARMLQAVIRAKGRIPGL